MKILVTGATGFLGRHIVERLCAESHEVTCIVRNAEKAKQLAHCQVRLVYGDLTDSDAVAEAVSGVHAVIHAAAVLGGWGTRELFVRNNLEATRTLLDAALLHRIARLIYVSSATSYGIQPGVRLTEEAPTRRERDPYCETKLSCEELLRRHTGMGGLRMTVLRPSIIYGPYDSRFLPQVTAFVKKGIVFAIGVPGQGPPLVYGKDVANFVSAILEHQTSAFEIFNLCNPEHVSWERIVGEVSAAVTVPARVYRIPFHIAYAVGGLLEVIWKSVHASRPPILTRFLAGLIGLSYHFDSSKALSVPGFDGFTPFSVGLTETLRWMNNQNT